MKNNWQEIMYVVLTCVLGVAAYITQAKAETFATLPEGAQLKTRVMSTPVAPGDDPFTGEANVVHNTPEHTRGFFSGHPTRTKLLFLLGGAVGGVVWGLHDRRSVCTNVMYEGHLYTGTPCPKEK